MKGLSFLGEVELDYQNMMSHGMNGRVAKTPQRKRPVVVPALSGNDAVGKTAKKRGNSGMSQDPSKKVTTMQAIGELPALMNDLNQALAAMVESNRRLEKAADSQNRTTEMLLGRMDAITHEMHAMTIFLSELVTYQSYILDDSTVDADSRLNRERVVNKVLQGD